MKFLLLFTTLLHFNIYAEVDYVFSQDIPLQTIKYGSLKNKINGYYIQKENTQKLAILIHGYLDNCSYMTYLQSSLWNENYSILCLELPGHGQSQGTRASVDSFETYGKMLSDIPSEILAKYAFKTFIAHSTGAIALQEALRQGTDLEFQKIFLIAPLVRSQKWFWAKLAHILLGSFIKNIPRRESKNKKYVVHRENDSRHIEYVHSGWVTAYRKWLDKIEKEPKYHFEKMTVIFPSDDEVIDISFNRDYYQKYFPNSKIYNFRNAGHRIQFEDDDIIKKFLAIFESNI